MALQHQISGMILPGTNFNMHKGFTLIELVLYIAIVSMMLITLIPFAWNIIEGGTKSSTQQEVFDNARYISEQIKYQIRNAIGINSVAPTQISLVTADSTTNPTIISLTGTDMTMKLGNGGSINLNSANATISAVSGVIFTNYTSADNKTKNIQFVFTTRANYSGSGSRQEFNESTTIEGDGEVRSN
jgi:Tfp pilus assembly protein PilE